MEFKQFIRAVHPVIEKYDGKNQSIFIINLFNAADTSIILTDGDASSKIGNWLKGTNEGFKRLFSEERFNNEEFINFLKKRTANAWQEIQKNFEKMNEYCYIDFTTDNIDIFYRSVLQQFKEIVGLPLDYIPIEQTADNQARARKSFENMLREANQGNSFAQYNLGLYYECTDDGGDHLEKAAQWYEKAALQNHAYAMERLGICYENGNGVERDYERAIYWYEKASKLGLITAIPEINIPLQKRITNLLNKI